MRPTMVTGILVLTIWILCISFTECCSGITRPYVDIRCYIEWINGQYILRPSSPGTYFNPVTCVMDRIPNNVHTENRRECERVLFGETVHISSEHVQSHSTAGSAVASSVQTSTTDVDQHNLCFKNHSYYRDVFNNAERENCLSPYSVFEHLDYLRRTDHYCASTLVRKMASLNLPNCVCSSRHIFYQYQRTQTYYDSCRGDHSFQEIMNTYLVNQPGHTIECQTRNKVWKDLLHLRYMDVKCFDDFVSHMQAAYSHNHEPNCYNACHSTTTQTQVTHSHSHELSQSEKYEAYKRGECLSEHTVWSFLYYEDRYPHGLNRETVIKQMAALFPNGTDNKCACTKSFDLHYTSYGRPDGTAWSCAKNYQSSPYRGALSHLLDYQNFVRPTAQICHSHAGVWQELNNILQHNHDGARCVENLIHHLYDAVYHQRDPCSCHAVSTLTSKTTETTTQSTITTTTASTTTTPPTTKTTPQPTTTTIVTTSTAPSTTTATTKPTTTMTSTETTTNNYSTTTSHSATLTSFSTSGIGQSTECSKIRTVAELAKFQQLYPEFNTNCSRQISTSNLIVRDLCDFIPISKYWKPGTRVVDACDTLKPYTPVATFSSSTYPLDGLAGVFLGCTPTSIRIATQECGGKFEIQEFLRHTTHFETFAHTALNFYVINF